MPDDAVAGRSQDVLPEWDLSDLFPGPDSAELRACLDGARRDAKAFQGRLEGRLGGLTGQELGEAIGEYEAIDEALSRVMSYASLLHQALVSDPIRAKFFQQMQEDVTDISSDLLFFTLEINRLDDGLLDGLLAAPALAKYAPWLRDLRAMRPHQLSDDIEKLLHDKHVAGRSAWTRLFDETIAGMRFAFGGAELTCTEVLHKMSDNDPAVRKAAALAVGKGFAENIRVFTFITNTLAKDKEIEDRWRSFAQPVSSRNLSNLVEDDVVDALVGSVKEAFPRLSHRYYGLKAKWFGVEQLDYWDRNAPLPDSDEADIPWAEAVETVLSAYDAFSPELSAIGQRFFDNAWIDVPPRPGKSGGAFAHPTVPSVHPYLLLNYQGKTRDVMTLAHELGHGVHQVLAGDQGHLLSDTPLTLAETASVFGEMLTFRSMLAKAPDDRTRRIMLAGKVEDMLNTVVRQVAFFEFERQVHDRRRSGELLAEDLGDIWMSIQSDSLGPALRFDDNYRSFWAYIPHFIHSPFYVYAYAFGDCLVNSLYAAYQASPDGFQAKYLDMLRAGGTLRHKELLAPFGLDASKPAFWDGGLSMIAGLIDELETVA